MIGVRAERGFTLLEVVVAMALFAFVMGLVYAGIGTAVRAYDAAELRTETASRMRVLSTLLRRSLGGAFPLAIPAQRDWQLLFEGDAARVRYVADLPGHVGVGGLHEIVLDVARGERQRLQLHRRPLSIAADGSLEGSFDTRVLLDDIGSLRLRYFGRDDDAQQATWREQWPAGKRMPELIEIRIEDARAQPWPALVVRPRVDALRYLGAGVEVPDDSRPGPVTAPQTPGMPASGAAAESPGTPAGSAPQQVPVR